MRIICMLCFIVIVGLALSSAAPADPPAAGTLTVTGSAEVKVQPDVAYVSLGVQTDDKDAAAAMKTTLRFSMVIQKLSDLGLRPSDEISHKQRMDPIYGPNQAGPTGYRVNSTAQVKAKNMSRVFATGSMRPLKPEQTRCIP